MDLSIRNKRGDIPVMVLVLGVVAICGLVILSFAINRGGTREDLNSVSMVVNAGFEMEKYNFYQLPEIDDRNFKDYFVNGTDVKGDFIWVGSLSGEVYVKCYP